MSCSTGFVKYAASIGVSINESTDLREARLLVDAKEEEINSSQPQQYWVERRIDAGGKKVPGETQAFVRLQAHTLELLALIDRSKITNEAILKKVDVLKKAYARPVKVN